MKITDNLLIPTGIDVAPHDIVVTIKYADGTEQSSTAIWKSIEDCNDLGLTPQKLVGDIYLHALSKKYTL